MQSQFVTAYQNKRNVTVPPFAFTEQGIIYDVYDALNYLIKKDEKVTTQQERKQIGYKK